MKSPLARLPVRPRDHGDDEGVKTAYLRELRAVETVEALKVHVTRWSPLFELGGSPPLPPEGRWEPSNIRRTRAAERRLVNGTFGAVQALRCIRRIRRTGECGHGPLGSCCGMHIAVPAPLIRAYFTAKHFGTPFDIALIQCYGGYEALYGEAP